MVSTALNDPARSIGLKRSVAAVVVTRNRLPLLKECIQALLDQSRPLDEIIVIDNSSDDGTAQWLTEQQAQHPKITLITQENLGSSGGQYRGIKEAYQKGHEWFWCMDDDTIPHADALERMAATPYFNDEFTGFLASKVVWIDGMPHRGNTADPDFAYDWYHTVLQDKCVRLTHSTFVSMLISRNAVTKVGLPLKEYFIWMDDVEYSTRIARHFKNYCVLDSVVVHKTKNNFGWEMQAVRPEDRVKFLYGLRNKISFIRSWDKSAIVRFIRISEVLLGTTKMAVTGRAPGASIWWMLRGLFFRPKIQRP